ncbi:MAG: AraC family transcriptional regulator [Planctomycetota bacterium]
MRSLAGPDLGGAEIYETRYPAGRTQPRHAHDYTKVSFVLAGSVVERVHGATRPVRALEAIVKPAGTEHSDAFGARGAWLLTLRLPPSHDADHDALDQYRLASASDFGRAAVTTIAALRGLAPSAAAATGLRRLLAALRAPEPAATTASPPLWLAPTVDAIHATYQQPILVGDLARRAGVHPVHFARVFRRHVGCTVRDYRRRLRLQAAATAMALGDQPLAEVAVASGFADQPHMSRLFKQWAGLSPRRYRALADPPAGR